MSNGTSTPAGYWQGAQKSFRREPDELAKVLADAGLGPRPRPRPRPALPGQLEFDFAA